MPRIIAHFDMDAFFAAIEERDNPQWRGQPIAIGATPHTGQGRGVVSTANYVARAYGIHSAMPIKKAWQASARAVAAGKPAVIFLPGSFRHYHETSQQIMNILRQYVPHIYQRSVDEAYGDVSHTGSYDEAKKLAAVIQQAVFDQTQLTISIGVGPNKLLAKIASDFHKPHGLTIVPPPEVLTFLAPLPIQTIPGVGPKTTAQLAQLGITTIESARAFSVEQLANVLGKWGVALYDKVRGQDASPLRDHQLAKSISEQTTLPADSLEPLTLIARLLQLSVNVHDRLQDEGFTGYRTLTLIVRFADFETHTSASTFPKHRRDLKSLQQTALRLVLPFIDRRRNPHQKPWRLLGLRLEKLKTA